jgi:hypothetical protein
VARGNRERAGIPGQPVVKEEPPGPVLSGVVVVTRTDAQRLDEKLRNAVQDLYELLIEAVSKEIWRPLGFADLGAWYSDVTVGKSVSPQTRAHLAGLLRSRGYSLRAIGGVLQVNKDTVAHDLRQGSHDGTPDRVTGLDGRSRPAGWKQLSSGQTVDQKREEMYAALQEAAERSHARREAEEREAAERLLARREAEEQEPVDAEQIRREAEEHAAWALRSAEVNRVLDAAVLLHPDAAPVVITVTVYPARPTADDTADTGRASTEDISRAIAVLQRRYLSLHDDDA